MCCQSSKVLASFMNLRERPAPQMASLLLGGPVLRTQMRELCCIHETFSLCLLEMVILWIELGNLKDFNSNCTNRRAVNVVWFSILVQCFASVMKRKHYL